MLKQNTRKVYCRQFCFIQSWSQQCSTVLQYHFKQKAMYTMYCFNCPSSLSAIMVFFQFRHRTQVHDKPCICILHLFKLYYAQYSVSHTFLFHAAVFIHLKSATHFKLCKLCFVQSECQCVQVPVYTCICIYMHLEQSLQTQSSGAV